MFRLNDKQNSWTWLESAQVKYINPNSKLINLFLESRNNNIWSCYG
jgi:hypothetical protein